MTIQRASILDQPAHYLEGADFQIIVPEESTNLITNPSIETNTTGWTASLATMTRDTARSFFGAAALKLNYGTAGAGSYAYTQVSVSPSTTYTLSAYAFVESATGAAAGDNAMAVVDGATTYAVTGLTKRVGHWRRWTLTFTTGAATTSVYVDLYCPKGVVFWDGVQLEAKPYVTTYIDGEQDDCIWMGAQHASASYRPVATRKGGRPMKLSDYKFKVVSVIGAGAAALTTVATPYANIGGGYYQRSIPQSRTLQIAGQFECASHIDLMRNRSALIDAVNPNRTPNPQPARLLYTPLGCASDEPAKQIVIDGVYAGGLEGNQTNEVGVERAVMAFNVFLPFAAIGNSQQDKASPLQFRSTITTVNGVVRRNMLSGEWTTAGSLFADGFGAGGYAITLGGDGYFYAAYTLSGVDQVVKWDGVAWTNVGTTANGAITALAWGADGNLYAAGSFTNIGGTAATRIARWNGSSWAAVGSGANASIVTMKVGPDGNLYIGGLFTTVNGGAAVRVAKYNYSTWSAFGSGPVPTTIHAIEIGKDGSVYAGGDGGEYIQRWNGSAWVSMGGGLNDVLYDLLMMPNGTLLAAGSFTTAGGATVSCVALWNGAGWYAMSGISGSSAIALALDAQGNAYVFGNLNGIANNSAYWTGSSWVYGDINAGSSGQINGAAFSNREQIFVGLFTTVSTASSTQQIAPGNPAMPRLILTGPGTPVSLRNWTNGTSILFNLTIGAGEIVTLTLNGVAKLTSNVRGDITTSIAGFSTPSQFKLEAGVNNITFYMLNTTGASAATLVYREMYSSLDASQ